MKKSVIVCSALLLAAGTAVGQDITEKEVPSVVLNEFKKEFQKATDVEWEMKNGNYDVEFDVGNADHEVWYDAAGKIVKHKEDISQSDLPEAVNASIKKNFDGYRASDFKRITTGNEVSYRVDLEKGTDELEVTFDTAGVVVKKVND